MKLMNLLAKSRASILAVMAVSLFGVTCYGQKGVEASSNKLALPLSVELDACLVVSAPG